MSDNGADALFKILSPFSQRHILKYLWMNNMIYEISFKIFQKKKWVCVDGGRNSETEQMLTIIEARH